MSLQDLQGSAGVLCGGPSREREISLRSGRAIHEALLSLGLPSRLVILSQDPNRIPEELAAAKLGCAFVALHGWFGEDGTLQGILEEMNVPYTGSGPEACRYGMDKAASRRRWLAAGLPIPRWQPADSDSVAVRAARMPFPVVLKPVCEGSSLGISIVDAPEQLPAAAEQAGAFSRDWILEEYLAGPELTVGILQARPLPVIQIVPRRRFYDYTAKYTPGMTEYLVPAPLEESVSRGVRETALAAHEALGCHSFSRVDLILTADRGPVLLELNPIPGMTQTSLLPKAAAAAGLSFAELCRRMLESAWQRSPRVGCPQ